MDQATGTLNMKKLKPWINTISPVVSYLFRCNTDVTNLRSGTALKGVILYISDYITKVSLKTHTIFDVIQSVYRDNIQILEGSDSHREKTRRLMMKIVNSLTSKMELGAPMIAMYLLGNPDHYTSHRFTPFYWSTFVKNIERAWQGEDLDTEKIPDKVMLIKKNNRIVGLPNTYDYTYRAEALAGPCLYDWVSRCRREKVKGHQKDKIFEDDAAFTDSEHHCSTSDNVLIEGEIKCDVSRSKNIKSGKRSNLFPFLSDHPLSSSHATRCLPPVSALVPNFIGPPLPRCDHGDREHYCMVMLMFFKPWRTGLELKRRDQTWDDAFLEHEFTLRQHQLMKNFNLRHECLDARDDFHAQLQKGDSAFIPSWDSADSIEIANDLDQQHATSDVLEPVEEVEIEVSSDIGKLENRRRVQVATMDKILRRLGWDQPKNATSCSVVHPPPSIIQSGPAWRAAVKQKRQEVLDLHACHVPSDAKQSIGRRKAHIMDGVDVIDKSYLERKCRSPEWDRTISGVVSEFHLNREQERAFCIVANHICHRSSEQLKMYIGGMAGTGKSQVLKAVIRLFELRNECHRFVVVAPTGSAAALLGGSTYHSMFGINE